ncbi:response regulator [Aminobacter sp. HY435]|uniref:response regulator n=1 Tax=Aminobacter sp. HY435 TaxID=2970917 RepID=UPI0022B9A094|nr:response regulator [Aminobacter sp. HY435]
MIAFDVEQLCRDNGAQDIVIASNLRDAQNISQPFDVAIIDVMLDGEPTLDFAKGLEASGVPFVFATGYDRIDEIFSGFPGVGLISKPYSGTDLVEAVVASFGKPASSTDG